MRTIEVASSFMNKKVASASNAFSTGATLFSYATCIAEWTAKSLIVNATKYSVTTSKLQHWLIEEVNKKGLTPFMLKEVPIGTQSLKEWKNSKHGK